MSSSINKPTGLGYCAPMTRRCAVCDHVEMKHYGVNCLVDDCCCLGFVGRKLTRIERVIIKQQRKRQAAIEYVGEAYLIDLKRDVEHRTIEGVD